MCSLAQCRLAKLLMEAMCIVNPEEQKHYNLFLLSFQKLASSIQLFCAAASFRLGINRLAL